MRFYLEFMLELAKLNESVKTKIIMNRVGAILANSLKLDIFLSEFQQFRLIIN